MSLQDDFVAALTALAPEGISARVQTKWANTGTVYYQNADFETILGVAYFFQDTGASFHLTETTDAEQRAIIGVRSLGTRPQGMTGLGWNANYGRGELKQVRDGVETLLTMRTAVKNDDPGLQEDLRLIRKFNQGDS